MTPRSRFSQMHLPPEPTTTAPDGSDVRVLLALAGGSMAHFQLGPGSVSRAVRHRTVEEIWYVLAGAGEMWRRDATAGAAAGPVPESIVPLDPGTCLTIPAGTAFQFRTAGAESLQVVAVTMPPWPGEGEAEVTAGCPSWTSEADPAART